MAKFKKQEIEISKIYLDNENPRHETIDNEPEIIAYLLSKDFVMPLAADIAKAGSTSPLERFAVLPHPVIKGAYVSAEGNRRLCALKLLHTPDKAITNSRKKQLRALVKRWGPPQKLIDAVIFEDRKDARHWLELRHEGTLNGVGTRPWNARQKERFDRGGNKPVNPNTQAALLLEYALKRKLITDKEYRAISITTLTRFLTNPVVREALGLATGKDLTIHAPQAEVDKAAKRFLRDAYIGGNSGVTSRTGGEERRKYAHKLRTDGYATTTRLSANQALDPRTGKGSTANGGLSTRGKTRHSQHPDKRAHVIPTEFSLPIKNRVLKRIFDELREIETESFSFASAYLLRAMIEQIAHLFCKENGLGHDADLHVLIGRVAEKLVADGVAERELKPLRVMASDKHGRFSPDTLGAFVHGSMIPTRAELNRSWDEIEGSLRLIFDRLK